MNEGATKNSKIGSKVKRATFLLLLGLILMEARAKLAYSAAISGLDTLLEKSAAEGTLAAVEQAMPLFPSKSLVAEGATSDLYIYSWASLFNYGGYKISLYYSNDASPRMLKFKMGTATLEMVKPVTAADAIPQSEGGIRFEGSSI